MTTTWTEKSKASGTGWSPSNRMAKITYDDPNTMYDASNVTYDGVFNTFTQINKVSGTSWTQVNKAT